MKLAFLSALSLALLGFSSLPAVAGDTIYGQHTTSFHVRAEEYHPRVSHGPFFWLSRPFETFLHAPQILSETIEGDRALVNRRGILGPREVPVEDAIISPAD